MLNRHRHEAPSPIRSPRIAQSDGECIRHTTGGTGTLVQAVAPGHVGETARLLYLALHEVNRLDINIDHRLDFLEQLAPPLQGVLTSLKPHYSGKPFPLAPKAVRVAQLASELQAAMIIGYQIVMRQSDSLHWFRQRKWERVWTTALHRMLCYFNGIFCIRYQLHLPPPGK